LLLHISWKQKQSPLTFFFNFWFVFCHKDGVGGAEIKLFASAIPGCIRQGQRKRGSVIIFHKAIISNFTLSWHPVSFYLFLFQIERYYLKIGFLENFEAILRRWKGKSATANHGSVYRQNNINLEKKDFFLLIFVNIFFRSSVKQLQFRDEKCQQLSFIDKHPNQIYISTKFLPPIWKSLNPILVLSCSCPCLFILTEKVGETLSLVFI